MKRTLVVLFLWLSFVNVQYGQDYSMQKPNRETLQLLKTAHALIAEEKYADSVRLLWDLYQNAPNVYLEEKDNPFASDSSALATGLTDDSGTRSKGATRSFSEAMSEILEKLPPKGLEFLEVLAGADAQRDYQQAVESGNPQKLALIVDKYPGLKVRQSAAFLLGFSYYNNGEFQAAERVFSQLASQDSACRQYDPALSLLWGAAIIQSNQERAKRQALTQLKRKAEAENWSSDDLQKLGLRISEDELKLVGGMEKTRSSLETARSQYKTLIPLLMSDWSVPSSESGVVIDLLSHTYNLNELAVQQRFARGGEIVACPRVFNDIILARTPFQLSALDRKTGKVLWKAGTDYTKDLEAFVAKERSPIENQRFHAQNAVLIRTRVMTDATYNAISVDREDAPTVVYTVDDFLDYYFRYPISAEDSQDYELPNETEEEIRKHGTNRLCAYEVKTGKPLWTVGSAAKEQNADPKLEKAIFLSAPAVANEKLYASADIEGSVELLCLDRQTGKLDWSVKLAENSFRLIDAMQNLQPFAGPDDTLYVPTPSGRLCAVRQSTRRLLWSFKSMPGNGVSRNKYMFTAAGNSQRTKPLADCHGLKELGQLARTPDTFTATLRYDFGRILFRSCGGFTTYCINPETGEQINKIDGQPRSAISLDQDYLYFQAIQSVGRIKGLLQPPVVLKGEPTTNSIKVKSTGNLQTRTYKLEDGTHITRIGGNDSREFTKPLEIKAFNLTGTGKNKFRFFNAHGYRDGGFYYVPTTDKEILEIDLKELKAVRTAKNPDNIALGNLVYFDGRVYTQSFFGVSAFTIEEIVKGSAVGKSDSQAGKTKSEQKSKLTESKPAADRIAEVAENSTSAESGKPVKTTEPAQTTEPVKTTEPAEPSEYDDGLPIPTVKRPTPSGQPEDVEAILRQARLAWQTEKTADALAAFKSAYEKNPQAVQTSFIQFINERGAQLIKSNKNDLPYIESVLYWSKDGPKRASALSLFFWYNFDAAMKAGQYEQAAQWYRNQVLICMKWPQRLMTEVEIDQSRQKKHRTELNHLLIRRDILTAEQCETLLEKLDAEQRTELIGWLEKQRTACTESGQADRLVRLLTFVETLDSVRSETLNALVDCFAQQGRLAQAELSLEYLRIYARQSNDNRTIAQTWFKQYELLRAEAAKRNGKFQSELLRSAAIALQQVFLSGPMEPYCGGKTVGEFLDGLPEDDPVRKTVQSATSEQAAWPTGVYKRSVVKGSNEDNPVGKPGHLGLTQFGADTPFMSGYSAEWVYGQNETSPIVLRDPFGAVFCKMGNNSLAAWMRNQNMPTLGAFCPISNHVLFYRQSDTGMAALDFLAESPTEIWSARPYWQGNDENLAYESDFSSSSNASETSANGSGTKEADARSKQDFEPELDIDRCPTGFPPQAWAKLPENVRRQFLDQLRNRNRNTEESPHVSYAIPEFAGIRSTVLVAPIGDNQIGAFDLLDGRLRWKYSYPTVDRLVHIDQTHFYLQPTSAFEMDKSKLTVQPGLRFSLGAQRFDIKTGRDAGYMDFPCGSPQSTKQGVFFADSRLYNNGKEKSFSRFMRRDMGRSWKYFPVVGESNNDDDPNTTFTCYDPKKRRPETIPSEENLSVGLFDTQNNTIRWTKELKITDGRMPKVEMDAQYNWLIVSDLKSGEIELIDLADGTTRLKASVSAMDDSSKQETFIKNLDLLKKSLEQSRSGSENESPAQAAANERRRKLQREKLEALYNQVSDPITAIAAIPDGDEFLVVAFKYLEPIDHNVQPCMQSQYMRSFFCTVYRFTSDGKQIWKQEQSDGFLWFHPNVPVQLPFLIFSGNIPNPRGIYVSKINLIDKRSGQLYSLPFDMPMNYMTFEGAPTQSRIVIRSSDNPDSILTFSDEDSNSETAKSDGVIILPE